MDVLQARGEEVAALVDEDDGGEHRDRLRGGGGTVELETAAEEAGAAEGEARGEPVREGGGERVGGGGGVRLERGGGVTREAAGRRGVGRGRITRGGRRAEGRGDGASDAARTRERERRARGSGRDRPPRPAESRRGRHARPARYASRRERRQPDTARRERPRRRHRSCLRSCLRVGVRLRLHGTEVSVDVSVGLKGDHASDLRTCGKCVCSKCAGNRAPRGSFIQTDCSLKMARILVDQRTPGRALNRWREDDAASARNIQTGLPEGSRG